MRNTMKRTLAALACLALIPAAATASYRVGSPIPGTVVGTTYSSSGSFHGALDISSGQCNYWGVETGVVGSLSWNFTIRTTGVVCSGTGSGTQNEVKHTFPDGYTFRIWHFIKTADSYDRTCDRCQVGNEGATGAATSPHVHLQYDKLGTLNTSWYSAYATKGEYLDRGETIGYIQ
jgi:hypothetical protein